MLRMFPSASRRLDDDWILIFGWTFPLTKPASQISLFSVFIIGANFKVWFKEKKEKLPTHIQIMEFVANLLFVTVTSFLQLLISGGAIEPHCVWRKSM